MCGLYSPSVGSLQRHSLVRPMSRSKNGRSLSHFFWENTGVPFGHHWRVVWHCHPHWNTTRFPVSTRALARIHLTLGEQTLTRFHPLSKRPWSRNVLFTQQSLEWIKEAFCLKNRPPLCTMKEDQICLTNVQGMISHHVKVRMEIANDLVFVWIRLKEVTCHRTYDWHAPFRGNPISFLTSECNQFRSDRQKNEKKPPSWYTIESWTVGCWWNECNGKWFFAQTISTTNLFRFMSTVK